MPLHLEVEEHPITKAIHAATDKYVVLILQILNVVDDAPRNVNVTVETKSGKLFEMKFVEKLGDAK